MTKTTGGKVLRNAGALFVSQMITWSMTFVLTLFLPRHLGATNVGRLVFANSLWAVATVLVTFGMDVHLTKEIARQPERLRSLLRTSFALRVVLFVLGMGGVLLYLRVVQSPRETVMVATIIGVANLFWLLANACQAALQGIERMEYVALGSVVGKAVYSSLAIAMLLAGLGLYAVAVVSALGAAVSFVIEARYVLRLAPEPPGDHAGPWSTIRSEARRMLKASLPYMMSDAFLVAYMQADVLILSLLLDERAVGWYGVANQLFGTFLFVPSILITAIFPALSRFHTTEPELLVRYMRRTFDLLMLLAVPIGFGLVIMADPLVIRLFGREFANSGPVLAVLGIVLILTFQNMLVGRFLVATDRQRQWTVVQATLGLVTIPLDLVLVPWCQRIYANGALGGAMSYIITELAMLAVGIFLLPRGSLVRANAALAARSLIAGLVMIAATWWSRGRFFAIPLVIGSVSYLSALWVLRAVPAEELQYVRDLVVSAVQRARGAKSTPAVEQPVEL